MCLPHQPASQPAEFSGDLEETGEPVQTRLHVGAAAIFQHRARQGEYQVSASHLARYLGKTHEHMLRIGYLLSTHSSLPTYLGRYLGMQVEVPTGTYPNP